VIVPFRNEPVLRFDTAEIRAQAEAALAEVRRRAAFRVDPLWIGGRAIERSPVPSENPSRPEEVVGRASQAGAAEAEQAMAAAHAAFRDWRRVPARERAMVLLKGAAEMRRRRLELDALEVLEAGKTWPEADGDVAEAIDFLEYYARQMLRLDAPIPVVPIEGEYDEAFYVPLGVGVVIPPWNFPLAILTGMTSAALVTGNSVVLKPASPTQLIAGELVSILHAAGLPPEVLQYVPGPGGQIGDLLVDHPLTRFVSFTGSREVGLRIVERAARTQAGQRHIKRVVAEMGGKDAILVDETADLEAAARAVIASAFGYQGQKCSACSRLILVDAIYDEVTARVAHLAEGLAVGEAERFDVAMGPVIERRAYEKIQTYRQYGREHARVLAGGGEVPGPGYFLPATVFGDVDPDGRLGQEEIFGPVLSVIRARDFDHGLEIMNGTEYGLTGSVFSSRRDRLARARAEVEVGNLYFNRGCTGALVGVHPFGGFNMSGTDSKTGSPDYLLLFMQAKSVAERL
jgi:1-pyrroline-5-carboxylate dehydrogenase